MKKINLAGQDFGKIEAIAERFWSKVDMRNPFECWPWLAAVRRKDEGYGAFWMNRRHQPASRVAYILVFGTIPVGLKVCHHCDNPNCCNPEHLFTGTHLDNMYDMVKKNRKPKGVIANHSGKLNEDDVLFIRKSVKNKTLTQKKLAKLFYVGTATVSRVVRGKTYVYYN